MVPDSVKIFHCAFADNPDSIGVRTIFNPFGDAPAPAISEKWAEQAFILTNHPEPPEFSSVKEGRCYSLSVGDVVAACDNHGNVGFYLCCSSGWFTLAKDEEKGLKEYSDQNAKWAAELTVSQGVHRPVRYWIDLAHAKAV